MTVGLTQSPLQFWNLFHTVWKRKKKERNKQMTNDAVTQK